MLSPKIFFQRLDDADFVSELAQVSINYLEGIVSVAFARKNGTDILCNKILNNKKVIFFIGINNGVTSKQALEYLLDQDTAQEIYLVNTGNAQAIFHPKIFCFYNASLGQGILSIGSSNLTSGGFEKNIEANLILHIDGSNWNLVEAIRTNLNSIKAECIYLHDKQQLDDLLLNGFLEDENKREVFEARSSTPVNPLSSRIPKVQLHSVIKSQTLSNQLAVPAQQSFGVPQYYSHVWQSKPLTERDLNVPTGPNTNVTGSMLWKRGLSNLDQLHDFYSKIFNGLAWHPDNNPIKSHLLRANAQFDIYIHGVFQGSFNLTLTHNTLTNTRSYKQGNSMTSISWGDAKSIIANPAYLNLYMHLYKSVNPSDPFILTIEN